MSDFLETVYAYLYENATHFFPEFEFRPLSFGKGFQSSNKQKTDGTVGDKKGAVYYYQNTCFGLKDYTRGFVSIWEYMAQRERLEQKDVFSYLCALTGIYPQREQENEAAIKKYHEQSIAANIWENANDFFIHSLSAKNDTFAKTPRAEALRKYLIKERGYEPALFRLPDTDFHKLPHTLELGFIPSQEALYEYLISLNYQESLIKSVIRLPQSIGNNHILTIPYRDNTGKIKGIATRTITPLMQPKYLYSEGLERGKILFNAYRPIQKEAPIVIVEGLLDALFAEALGLKNVWAVGGSELLDGQLEALNPYKNHHIVLFLDNDEAGKKGTRRAAEKLWQQGFKTFFVQDPPYKDLDECLRHLGKEKTQKLIREAIPPYLYAVHHIIEYALELQKNNENNQLTYQDIEQVRATIVAEGARLPSAHQAQSFYQKIVEVFQSQIDIIDLADEIEAQRQLKIQQDFRESIKKILRQTEKDLSKENTLGVSLNWLEEAFKKLKTQYVGTTEYENLRNPISERNVTDALLHQQTHLKTGYTLTYEHDDDYTPLVLPSGAISFVCAPTSHGKTTMLMNLALNIPLNNSIEGKEIHFFSFEESREAIILKLLNIFLDRELSINNRHSIESYFQKNKDHLIEPKILGSFERDKAYFFEHILNKYLFVHYIDYSSAELIEAISYLNNGKRLAAVFVDYMQLLRYNESKRFTQRQEELKRICLDLKDMAIREQIPLVLGAQFNREVTNPLKLHASKIGEAGDIERVASVVLGMWNNDFEPLGDKIEVADIQNKGLIKPNSIYIKLLKNRNGRTGGENILEYNGNRGKIYVPTLSISPTNYLPYEKKVSSTPLFDVL